MKRAALYVRVSTAEQKKFGMSVDSQIDALRKYCKDNDYIEVDVYNDAGHTARKAYRKRSELLRLTDDCRAGKIDIIIFTKLDRWFRSVADYYEIQKILDDNNVKWKTIWEDYDTETSAGVFKVNIMLAIAQAEADRTSERIKAVNEYRREVKHEYTSGKAPTGYIVKQSQLLVDPERQEAVSAFFNEYLTTYNVTSAVKVLHAAGVMIRRDTARRMLNNPTYYGDAYGYKCEPYITREDFDKIQEVLAGIKSRQPKYGDRVYLFSGLMVCAECGSKLHASVRAVKSGKNTKMYKYYRCPKHRNMACDMSRSMTEAAIERSLISQIDGAMSQYNATIETEIAGAVDNTKKIASLEDRLDRIKDLYELGDLTREEYIGKKKTIGAEILTLQAPPVKHEKKALPDGWLDIYKSLSDSGRRAFWINTLSRVSMDQDGIIKLYF